MVRVMRGTFHGELAQLGAELATMCTLAAGAMEHATTALLTADLRLAEQVISGDARITSCASTPRTTLTGCCRCRPRWRETYGWS